MTRLSEKLRPTVGQRSAAPKPEFFVLTQSTDQAKLEQLLAEQPATKVIDTYESQLKEWFVLQNPWLHLNPVQRDKEFKIFCDTHYGTNEPWQMGGWVYLSWRHVVLHILPDAEYQQVRTGRNRNLITPEEQQRYYDSHIGIAGLSVGNSCALALVLTGGAKHLRLADADMLELTNLNRIRGSIAELTEPKIYLTARQIYELDPYADLTLYPDGLTANNLTDFMTGLDVVIDEIDNLGMKIRIRQEAAKHRIPVVMAADNGDSGVVDVERHDLARDIPLFHGRAGEDIAQRVLEQQLPLPVIGKIIGEELLGFDLIEPRMQQSLLAIGRTIPTWPQLGNAAVLNGVAVAYIVRRIVNEQPVLDNRAVLSIPAWLVPDYMSEAAHASRNHDTAEFAAAYSAAITAFLASRSP